MRGGPVWERDGKDWPNRETSRFVHAASLRWHVQLMGNGPPLLLLHGTGAATHSWRDLGPMLAREFTVIAPDMPGHGFTERPADSRLSLPGMARSIAALLAVLKIEPVMAAGHSAGAAILARMTLDCQIAPRHLISLNGALLPLFGVPTRLFSPVAKIIASMPLVPELFAWRASDPSSIARLLRGTGSMIDDAGTAFYGRLAGNASHVAGALGMMANWDLKPIQRDLPRLTTPLTLAVGTSDGTISPTDAYRIRTLVPGAKIVRFAGLGHLAHEEKPAAFADLINDIGRSAKLLP
jgi:magnesium chelatase accessory protein